MKPVVAEFDGVCGLCDEPIVADVDRIVRLEEDDEWVHAQCAEDDGEDVDD